MTSFQCEHPTASWGIPEVRKFARQMVGEYVHALCRLTSAERAQVGLASTATCTRRLAAPSGLQ